ncbi:MAG: hypothetical protein JW395_3061 [Nitrospira sp.]|nr:hypothetical protein [Nitrospira sp.]
MLATTMAQNSAKLSAENGAVAGVASVVVASITSPSRTEIFHVIKPNYGRVHEAYCSIPNSQECFK